MRIICLLLTLLLVLAGCTPAASPAPQTPTPLPSPSEPPSTQTIPKGDGVVAVDTAPVQTPGTLAPAPDQRVPPAQDVPLASEPSDLGLNGELSWMWERDIPAASTIVAMYNMCSAFIGTDAQGRKAVYAGSVYEMPADPIYSAGQEYPHIGSVTGSKYSVYFIEHNNAAWRLLFLPLDSSPQEAEVIDQGEGLIPVLSPDESSLTYLVQSGDSYLFRVWQKHRDASTPTKLLGEIPLPDTALIEQERSYLYNEAGVTYAVQTDDGGYAAAVQSLSGESTLLGVGDEHNMPRQVQMDSQAGATVWLDAADNLYVYLSSTDSTWLLGRDVRWFSHNEGTGLYVFASGSVNSELYVAAVLADGSMARLPLAQSNWRYLAGVSFSQDGSYLCVVREQDGRYQFTGMELRLQSGE